MECSFDNATYKGLYIIKVLNYTGDYVLFKTSDGKLHVAHQNEIIIGD